MPYKFKISEETDPIRIEKRREKNRRLNKNWRLKHKEENKEKRKSYSKDYRKNSIEKLKHSARKKLQYAVSVGKVLKLPCKTCGDLNSQAHHDDYSKPLQVHWFCPKHHGQEHRLKS